MIKQKILMGCSTLALVAAGMPAMAQDAEPEATSVDEIVVTAQRRQERLQDVPLSVTVATAEQLSQSGVSGASELSQIAPGVMMQPGGSFQQPTVRGIGSTATGAGTDANVAIYIDGVYMANLFANFFEFNNIQQIEILKGPQGTLFGRNSTGGAIMITTAAPPDAMEGHASATTGSYDLFKADAYVGGPIGGGFRANVAAQFSEDDGWLYDVSRQETVGSQRDLSARAKLAYDFDDSLSAVLSIDYSRRNDDRAFSGTALNRNASAGPSLVPTDPRHVALTQTAAGDFEAQGANLRWRLDREYGTFTQLSSFRYARNFNYSDLDRTPLNIQWNEFRVRQQTISHELNFASREYGPFSYVTGVYYYNDRANNYDSRNQGGLGAVATLSSEAYAAYAEGTYDFSEAWRLIVGTRYSTEERTLRSRLPSTGAIINSSRTYSAWTPRVSLRYTVSEDLNFYATYSKGFKSGTYNVSTFADAPVAPEGVTALEAGAKYFADGVMFNASAYSYDYDNIQISANNPVNGVTQLTNAAKAEIRGAELEVRVPVSDALTVTGGLAYTDATYTDFPNAPTFTPRPNGAGNTTATRDVSGNDMVRSPKWTANVGLTYERPLFGGDLTLSSNIYYNGGFYWNPDNRVMQDAFTLVSGQASWEPQGSPYRVTVWGKNLTDELTMAYFSPTTTADGVTYAPPRTLGVTLSVDF